MCDKINNLNTSTNFNQDGHGLVRISFNLDFKHAVQTGELGVTKQCHAFDFVKSLLFLLICASWLIFSGLHWGRVVPVISILLSLLGIFVGFCNLVINTSNNNVYNLNEESLAERLFYFIFYKMCDEN